MLCWTPSSEFLLEFPYYLNLAGGALSVIGSIIIIIAYCRFFKRAQHQLLSTLIFFLSISDLIASSGIVASQTLLLVNKQSYGHIICVFFRCVIQYGYLSSFMWTSCIALFLYGATNQAGESRTKVILMHIVSWGLPAIIIIILLAGNAVIESDAGWCHTKSPYQWSLWFTPMLLSFIFNMMMYIMTLKKFTSSNAGRGQKMINNNIQKRVTIYLLIFILCWFCDIVDHIIEDIHCSFYILWLLQNITTPLQGFCNFLVYGITTDILSFKKHSQISVQERALLLPTTYERSNNK